MNVECRMSNVSNESERSFPQHCILSSTTLHSRSLPLINFSIYVKSITLLILHFAVLNAQERFISNSCLCHYYNLNKVFKGFVRRNLQLQFTFSLLHNLKLVGQTFFKNIIVRALFVFAYFLRLLKYSPRGSQNCIKCYELQ